MLGTNHEGWSEERSRVELDRVLAMIERGTWQPPTAKAAETAIEESGEETLELTVARWWQRKRRGLRPNSQADYRWRLDYILAYAPERRTASINARWVDEFRAVLEAQRTRRDKPLSPRSINMILEALAAVLDDAVRYELLDFNPARAKGTRVRIRKGARFFLEPEMVLDLLDAAGAWEAELPEHQRYGRRALLAQLCLAGPRISEALSADLGEFDLGDGRWRIPRAKTEAGEREVELPAYLLAELRRHVAQMRSLGRPLSATAPLWMSAKGRALNPSNVRNRLLAEAARRANEKRAEEGRMLLPDRLTPHALRRTFASLCFFAGRDLRFVMAQLGHADPRMTLGVYAQTMQRHRVDGALVWRLMRFGDEPGRAPRTNRLGH